MSKHLVVLLSVVVIVALVGMIQESATSGMSIFKGHHKKKYYSQQIPYKSSESDERSMSRSYLEQQVRETEQQQQALRDQRQMAMTQFQNSDQRQQQMHNQIAAMIKQMSEQRQNTVGRDQI